MNTNKQINTKIEQKLTYELWLKEYKNKRCRECLIGVPNPTACYICFQQNWTGFHCSRCSHFTYHYEGKVCGGSYDTGSCFCIKCQNLIKKALGEKKCVCEYSLIGFSSGHSIHNYHLTIKGLIKPFFKGSKLWIKLVCRSCEKLIQSFKLGCDCYLKQKEHSHLYNRESCLNCAIGNYVRPLSEWDLQRKYKDYCLNWQEKAEIHAEISIKKQYKYDGEGYWAKCSFCEGEIKGKQKDKEDLSRNKVSFWTSKDEDERVVCNWCLRSKKVLKRLEIKGIKRQMLYNYRARGII